METFIKAIDLIIKCMEKVFIFGKSLETTKETLLMGVCKVKEKGCIGLVIFMWESFIRIKNTGREL